MSSGARCRSGGRAPTSWWSARRVGELLCQHRRAGLHHGAAVRRDRCRRGLADGTNRPSRPRRSGARCSLRRWRFRRSSTATHGSGVIPSLHGLWAGVLITTLSYFPFMYLPVAATLRRLDPAVEESARTLGSDSVGVFFRVVLPQLRLAILGGGLLIGMHLLAEFGAFAMIRFDTFTVAIFQQFQVTFDGAAGSMLAGVLVLLCLVLLIAEAAARGKIRFARIGSGAPRAATPIRLGHSTIPALLRLPRWRSCRSAFRCGRFCAGCGSAAPTCGRSPTSAPRSPRPSAWRRRPRSSRRCWLFPSHGSRCGPAASLARAVEGANYVTSSLPGIVTALALVTVAIHYCPTAVPERAADRVRLRPAVHAARIGQRPRRPGPGPTEPGGSVPVAGRFTVGDVPPRHAAPHRTRRGCGRIAGIRRGGNRIDRNAAAGADRNPDIVDAVLVVQQRTRLRGRRAVRAGAWCCWPYR